jgi:HSP20 family protein
MTAIIRRIPSLLEEFDRLGHGVWGSWYPVTVHNVFAPTVDVHEDEGNLVVKAELPGVGRDDVKITLAEGTLHIEAEKKHEEETNGTDYYARERYFGRYSRMIPLPFHVDAEKASASFEGGLLEIRLPRAEEVKSRQIAVGATPSGTKRTAKKKPSRSRAKKKA